MLTVQKILLERFTEKRDLPDSEKFCEFTGLIRKPGIKMYIY